MGAPDAEAPRRAQSNGTAYSWSAALSGFEDTGVAGEPVAVRVPAGFPVAWRPVEAERPASLPAGRALLAGGAGGGVVLGVVAEACVLLQASPGRVCH